MSIYTSCENFQITDSPHWEGINSQVCLFCFMLDKTQLLLILANSDTFSVHKAIFQSHVNKPYSHRCLSNYYPITHNLGFCPFSNDPGPTNCRITSCLEPSGPSQQVNSITNNPPIWFLKLIAGLAKELRSKILESACGHPLKIRPKYRYTHCKKLNITKLEEKGKPCTPILKIW